MKKDNKRTGFTLVELLVVIAILAVLASVSVVGYLGFTKKAHVSNDISLTTQMNTILQAEEAGGETFETPHDAVEALQNGGLDLSKLNTSTSGYNYVYDLKENRMFLMDDSNSKVAPSNLEITGSKNELFAFVGNKEEAEKWDDYYGLYLKNNFDTSTLGDDKTLSVACSVDVGLNNVNVKYESTAAETVILRTYGGNLTVENTTSSAIQKHYGNASTVTVSTGTSCFDTNGAISKLEVKEGKVSLEEGAVAFLFSAKATEEGKSVSVEQNGGVAYIPSDVNASNIDSKVASGLGYTYTIDGNNYKAETSKTYDITNLTTLEKFRDLVNGGFQFKGLTVELKSDITLKDGWVPIGENGRYVNDSKADFTNIGSSFVGEFKGNGHTISNLNANGYVPGRTHDDGGTQKFVYGFFGVLSGDSKISDLTLSNVNIDVSASRLNKNNVNCVGDSVGGLVGYIQDNCEIKNVTVSGSINSNDCTGGIVGRWYTTKDSSNTSFTGKIENCVNNAIVKSLNKCAGIVGFTSPKGSNSLSITVSNCTNNGNIESSDAIGALTTLYASSTNFTVSNFVNNVKLTSTHKNSGITEIGTFNGTSNSNKN